MLKALRFLAFAFVALTVPVQGMAAVAAGQCMALGHHEEAAGNDAHALVDDAGHDHAAHAHEAGEGLEHENDGENAHCGPCTACCASASIAGAEAASIVAWPAVPSYTLSPSPPLGVEPEGLDRPPLPL